MDFTSESLHDPSSKHVAALLQMAVLRNQSSFKHFDCSELITLVHDNHAVPTFLFVQLESPIEHSCVMPILKMTS